ncbi:MAG: hydroxymethylbilane synthase (porphobilinogen deaminase) [Candidatus Scalindua rubra]|uniref:Porphobilinogen deaminase n=1 Tax=Candidatus Scalindua rubra TaxID=1872076 RepID=A0A1E3XA12_9BACT|nr:MAG: hydroxymethylbilane synthase (porphobilinogen deaminase) [Candidatus Scalindua rubra]
MEKRDKIVIGSRGSKLALIQANWAKSQLEEANKEIEFDIEKIKTTGDKITDSPLSKIGNIGLFTKELENALLDKKVDLVVHSAKDVPTEIPNGLVIGAVSKREDPHDVLISRDNVSLRDLPQKAKIGTSSLRRRSQILAFRSDLEIVDLRGNLDTRLKKLDFGELDAIVVARAGLLRFGLSEKASEIISYDIMLPAVGQGALCVEIRDTDHKVKEIISILNHHETMCEVKAERTLLAKLQGGCQIPIGAHAEVIFPVNLKLEAVVCSLDGTTIIRDSIGGKVDDFATMGQQLAHKLLGMGGAKILDEIRKGMQKTTLVNPFNTQPSRARTKKG